jgi:small subunit ribosomal protein S20
MPNTSSAKKRVRQNARRNAINKNRLTRVRTAMRKAEEAIAAGDKKAAEVAVKAAEPEIMRGAGKGVVHKRSGARKVSRLNKALKKMGG